MARAVDLDVAYGNSLGVTGTPKFFVSKIRGDEITDVIVISGAQSFAAFSGAIERPCTAMLWFTWIPPLRPDDRCRSSRQSVNSIASTTPISIVVYIR